VKVSRDFYLFTSDGSKRKKIPSEACSYVALKVSDDSLRIVKISSNVSDGYTGDESKSVFESPVAYKRGTIIVHDRTFQHKIQRIDSHTTQSSWDFIPTKQEDVQKYIDLFLESPEGESWAANK
jgi:hypothetical protein